MLIDEKLTSLLLQIAAVYPGYNQSYAHLQIKY